MNNWYNLIALLKLFLFLLFLGFFLSLSVFQNEATPANTQSFCGTLDAFYDLPAGWDLENVQLGKTLFRNNCAMCHMKDMKSDLTGPALGNAIERFQQDTIRLYRYLNDPALYLKIEGDTRMLQMHKTFGYIEKPSFVNLNIQELKAIIAYIEAVYY